MEETMDPKGPRVTYVTAAYFIWMVMTGLFTPSMFSILKVGFVRHGSRQRTPGREVAGYRLSVSISYRLTHPAILFYFFFPLNLFFG
jgi:hypothetical protein